MSRMKKCFFIAAISILVAASCQKAVETENKSNEGLKSFTATIANEDTKTYFDGSESDKGPYPVYWQNGDVVRLFNTDGTGFDYRATGVGDKQTTATFTPVSSTFTGTFACAYYPATQTIKGTTYQSSYSAGNIIAPISGTQSYLANSVAYGSLPMVGKGSLDPSADDMNITFHNLFSILELQLTGTASQTVSSITVESSAYCFGEATIDPSALTVAFNNADCRGKNMLLSGINQDLSSTVNSFYVAIPAGSQSFTVAVATSETEEKPLYVKTVSSARIFSRGTIKPMAPLAVNSTNFTKVLYSDASLNSPYLVNGTIFAPVNCGNGIHEGGLLYQYGRKSGCYVDKTDPENPTIVGQTIETETTAVGDEESGKFYKLGLTGMTNRWNSGTEDDPARNSTYDPCPDGWRVPTQKEWLGLFGGSNNFFVVINYVDNAYDWKYYYGNNAYKSGSLAYIPIERSDALWDLKSGTQIGTTGVYVSVNHRLWSSAAWAITGHRRSDDTVGGDGTYKYAYPVRCVSTYRDL